MDNLLDETSDLSSKIRVLLEDKPLFIKFAQKYLTKDRYTEKQIKKFPQERKKFDKEVEESREKDEKKKKDIFCN